MTSYRYITLVFVISQLVLCGCRQKRAENREGIKSEIPDSVRLSKDPGKPKISLDNFSEIPKEIEGCACFFSESEERKNKNEYLFVAGFDSTAFISIDNKLLKLRLISTAREPNSYGDYDHTDVYETENYVVTLDIKYLRQEGDEGWLNTGTITIQTKDGRKEFVKFFGGCGC